VPAEIGPQPEVSRLAGAAPAIASAPAGASSRPVPDADRSAPQASPLLIAGGTDLYVQQGETIPERLVAVLGGRPEMKGIGRAGGEFRVGALTTFEEFGTHPAVIEAIPEIGSFNHLIASWQIRNRATLAGNIVNASPIGDFTALLLALDARVVLEGRRAQRSVLLREFYRGYKKIDLRPGELLTEVTFADPAAARVNFEKVSKRTCLDIASVNSACLIRHTGDTIDDAHFSLGGVAPIPLYLHETSQVLRGRVLDLDTAWEAVRISQREIAPISDVRGSAEYKRLLARQLLISHFTTLFPERFPAQAFYAAESA
jgi:xanthine dehydrogenase small subunit